jgi:hypothetical protein
MKGTGCGCCACLAGGVHRDDMANRPGLSAIRYRSGSYGSFFDSMIRRLTVGIDSTSTSEYPLRALRTREVDDPAIALLDAWAVVGDILTFYQERIANEAFLRTALERRSILELGRLVGYSLKPGVAASAYLAYTLDETAKTLIPAGTKAQSIPGINELPQMFETSEATEARGEWNALRPRMSEPQNITLGNVLSIPSIWIKGTTTRIDVRDPLLFVFDRKGTARYALRRALKVTIDLDLKCTEISFEPVRPYYRRLAQVIREELAIAEKSNPPSAERIDLLNKMWQNVLLGTSRTLLLNLFQRGWPRRVGDALKSKDLDAEEVPTPEGRNASIDALLKPRSLAPASMWQLGRSPSLPRGSDFLVRTLAAAYPQLATTIYRALANNSTGEEPFAQFRGVHLLRRRSAVFGYNAPTVLFEDRPNGEFKPPVPAFVPEEPDVVHLDTPEEGVTVGSYVVGQNQHGSVVAKVIEAETVPRTAYGVSGKTSRLRLNSVWTRGLVDMPDDHADEVILNASKANLRVIRTTVVLSASEKLTLAQRAITQPIGKVDQNRKQESPTRIELDRVVDGFTPGRWIVVTGERVDTAGTSGIVAAELAMVQNVEQITDAGPGGTAYSVLVLAPEGLAYVYRRDTARILGNVVKATNGETRTEILGGGDAAKPMQTFTLRGAPLTFVSAPTVGGVASTLAIRVNDVLWHEVDSFADASPSDRVFITKTADDGKVSVVFGTGWAGARLPTGPDNVRTAYRTGIGRAANVRAGQIATAISRPLGIRDVVNPMPATGGADPESRDDARRNIPVSLQAMGRVVSVRDYADFARTFAGISKASATLVSDGRRRMVHLTIGGVDDIEIDTTSDLHRNLCEALIRYGNPYQPFVVELRRKLIIAGAARVRVDPDYLWTNVAPAIRAVLLKRFGYELREFGQPVYPAEIVAAIQGVPGVSFVDLDALGGIDPEKILPPKQSSAPLPSTPAATTPPATAPTVAAAEPSRRPDELQPVRVEGVKPIIPRLARRAHHQLKPAEIAYLTPELAELFILTEIPQ